MPDRDGLNLWFGQKPVGHLWRNAQGLIGFKYDADWLEHGGFPISQTLALQTGDFNPEHQLAHRFFANLLPEGDARTRIVRDLKISDTDFDLLRAIGGECAGALIVLPTGHNPKTNSSYLKLTDPELIALVRRRGHPFRSGGEDRPRLSLAGAQDKCPMLVKEHEYWLPQNESPSTHILKFQLPDYRHLPAYETFTTWLAAATGLPVVNIQLQTISDLHFAVIERYDRVRTPEGNISRLHQEDFCQALAYGHERKYQEDGGPTFADCFRLTRNVSTDPANDLQHLLRWQIFNVLAGNSDGHAKNLSLLYHTDGAIRLAPFYDLICTRAIEHIDEQLAFSIGTQRNPSLITAEHWNAMAKECGISPRFVERQVRDMAVKLTQQTGPVRQKFEQQFGNYDALQRIQQVVLSQTRRALAR